MFHVHDFGGSKTTQAHAELVLKFSALSFRSLDRGKKKGKRERERSHSQGGLFWQLAAVAPWLLGLLYAIKS
jgi:hypothetical protein